MERIEKLISGGAGYLILTLLSGGLIWGFADHYYDKGKADCKAEQEDINKKLDDTLDDFAGKIDNIDVAHDDEGKEIVREYRTGLSELDVTNAYRRGFADARRAERESDTEKGLDDEMYCFGDVYADDSKLRKSGESLQREIFGQDSRD